MSVVEGMGVEGCGEWVLSYKVCLYGCCIIRAWVLWYGKVSVVVWEGGFVVCTYECYIMNWFEKISTEFWKLN